MSPKVPTEAQPATLNLLALPIIGIENAQMDAKKEDVLPTNQDNESITVTKCHEDTSSHGDEKLLPAQSSINNEKPNDYVSLLEKRLDAMETELRRFKKPQKGDEKQVELSAQEVGCDTEGTKTQELQKIEIMRVPADRWRDFKTEGEIDPKLSILIVSSKKNIRIQRTRQKIPKMGDNVAAPEFGMPTPVETPYRLAINSSYLLNVLGQCSGTSFQEDHNVLVRPFKYLVANEAEIREFLKEVEAICDQAEAKVTQSPQEDCAEKIGKEHLGAAKEANGEVISGADTKDQTENNEDDDKEKLQEEARQARRNREEVRCLVEFMDKDMRDIFDIKRDISNHALTDIAFEHLWQLYKPGCIIYTSSRREDPSRCLAYRVLHVTGGRVCFDSGKKSSFNAVSDRKWESESENDDKCRDTVKAATPEMTTFIIDCYSLDFDGYRIGPKHKRFAIAPYNGQRAIISFPVYPSEFNPKSEEMAKTLIERGRRFTNLVLGTHKKYSGTTLREQNQTTGKSYINFVILDAEVKGEVMVDQASGVEHFKKKFYRWQIKFGGGVMNRSTQCDRREIFDPLPKKKDQSWITDVFDDSAFEEDRRSEFLRSTDELWFRSLEDPPVPDNILTLLPSRVYGYAVLNHKWFPLDINLVDDIDEEELTKARSGFDDLVLPEGHRMLLQALIKNQVRSPKETASKPCDDDDEFSMDLVKGKGKGLIILLHGVPGVGKTSTAECVAAQLRRPLLPITCGDIGTTARDAEETLENFCELAHRWRCVLLLDEADIFLAKREKGDIIRNSLVSVFLRVLEYYSGVIILTTNRVGEFDEAFRSRIHISLYYPKLDRRSTEQIWERNILRLKNSGLDIDIEEEKIGRFYDRHWQDNKQNPSRRWNGRQIKNAFQTALALANWDFYDTQNDSRLARPLLRAANFSRVAQTSAHFDDYISDIHGMQEKDTYSILAEREELRKDTNVGISPRTRVQEHFHRRTGATIPTRHATSYRGTFESYDDPSFENDEPRIRRTPTARHSARRSVDKQDVEHQDFDHEVNHEDGDSDSCTMRTGKARRGADKNFRSRDYHGDENPEVDDLDDEDLQRLELEVKLAKLKKRKGPMHKDEAEVHPAGSEDETW